MKTPQIILVPGWWLGAWAWDEVVADLRDKGHDVAAMTLPGLESKDADRPAISQADHVDAVVSVLEAAPEPVVLAVHSGSGFTGYAASDRVPEKIAAMVYVDTGAGVGAMGADFADAEKPLPPHDELASSENLDGLSEEQLRTFRERAVPEPGGVIRGTTPPLENDARLDIPSTVICTAYSIKEYKEAVEAGYDFVLGLRDLRHIDWVELPTSHWPMWSKPHELADIISRVAKEHALAG
jgi:pimeloyl-ACP methyl ester carboxylesterase